MTKRGRGLGDELIRGAILDLKVLDANDGTALLLVHVGVDGPAVYATRGLPRQVPYTTGTFQPSCTSACVPGQHRILTQVRTRAVNRAMIDLDENSVSDGRIDNRRGKLDGEGERHQTGPKSGRGPDEKPVAPSIPPSHLGAISVISPSRGSCSSRTREYSAFIILACGNILKHGGSPCSLRASRVGSTSFRSSMRRSPSTGS
jgi:hypothetical protein